MSDKQKTNQKTTSAENERLKIFVGKWHTSGEVAGTSPVVKIEATDTYEWLPGGYSLIHYIDSTIGKDEIHGIELIGYDESRKLYFAPFFDNQGSTGWEEVSVEGQTWTWHGKNVMGVNYHRCTAVFSDDGNVFHARHEKSADDKNWELWMDVTLTRQTEAKN